MVPVQALKPSNWDVRVLTTDDEERLKREVRGPERSFPVVARWVDGTLEVINGVELLRVAKQLGWKELPVIVVEDEEEAVRFCLHYNPLSPGGASLLNPGGVISYVKVARLVAEDERARRICSQLLGEEKVEDLLVAAKLLTPKAAEILQQEGRAGADITPEMLRVVAETPPEHQPALSAAAGEDVDLDYLLLVRERLLGDKKRRSCRRKTCNKKVKGGEKA
jgi:hypothetical protein